MAVIARYCDKCGVKIPQEDFEDGSAVALDEVYYCRHCKTGSAPGDGATGGQSTTPSGAGARKAGKALREAPRAPGRTPSRPAMKSRGRRGGSKTADAAAEGEPSAEAEAKTPARRRKSSRQTILVLGGVVGLAAVVAVVGVLSSISAAKKRVAFAGEGLDFYQARLDELEQEARAYGEGLTGSSLGVVEAEFRAEVLKARLAVLDGYQRENLDPRLAGVEGAARDPLAARYQELTALRKAAAQTVEGALGAFREEVTGRTQRLLDAARTKAKGLAAEGRFDEALAAWGEVPESVRGDAAWVRDVQPELQRLRDLSGARALVRRLLEQAQRLAARGDYRGAVGVLEACPPPPPDLEVPEQAQMVARLAEFRAKSEQSDIQSTLEAQAEEAYTELMAQADSMAKENKFLDAIDLLGDPDFKKKYGSTPFMAKVKARVEELKERHAVYDRERWAKATWHECVGGDLLAWQLQNPPRGAWTADAAAKKIVGKASPEASPTYCGYSSQQWGDFVVTVRFKLLSGSMRLGLRFLGQMERPGAYETMEVDLPASDFPAGKEHELTFKVVGKHVYRLVGEEEQEFPHTGDSSRGAIGFLLGSGASVEIYSVKVKSPE
ncbi:MAG: hypothetical protein HY722_05090 [Planctomycetes bacterium]|nr:hypothetical protein [Planctomycetota bacterium]